MKKNLPPLTLNRQTVRSLQPIELPKVQGGAIDACSGCDSTCGIIAY
jgi:hypothetical protein